MHTFLSFSPILILVIALTGFKLTAFRAGLLTLVWLAVALFWIPGAPPVMDLWGVALADAGVLAMTVGETLFFGLLLYQLMQHNGQLSNLLAGVHHLGRSPAFQLMWVLLVFAPLFEAISGFGLGIVMVAPMLLHLGYTPARTMVLVLLSQLAVPWGALSIGMALGGQMVGIPLGQLGSAAAVQAVPMFGAYWGMALWLARPKGAMQSASLLQNILAVLVFSLGVWGCNRWGSPELGAVAGALGLGVWLQITGQGLDSPPSKEGMERVILAGTPYAVLIGLLSLTRFWGALQGWLADQWVVSLPGSQFSLPLLYNPGGSLAVACLWALFYKGDLAWRQKAVMASLKQWGSVAMAVFVLVLVARAMEEGGMIRELARAAVELPMVLALPALAFLSGVGGFLTGSVTAANALLIAFQVKAATGLGLPVIWVAGLHNVLAAGFMAFSPGRLVFAAVLTGEHGKEGLALQKLWPLAGMLVGWGVISLLLAKAGVWSAVGWLLPG